MRGRGRRSGGYLLAAAGVALAMGVVVWRLLMPAPVAPCPVFPATSPWNQRVDDLELHPLSDKWIASMGEELPLQLGFGPERGHRVHALGADARWLDVALDQGSLGCPEQLPLPDEPGELAGAAETSDDRLLAVYMPECLLVELFVPRMDPAGAWSGRSAACWDLRTEEDRIRMWFDGDVSEFAGVSMTAAQSFPPHDGSGLPVMPGLIRADEVSAGEISHALRLTTPMTRRGYIAPALHGASMYSSAALPPMGARFRVKATVDCQTFTGQARPICLALQRYGAFLSDNGPSWTLSGQRDSSWDSAQLEVLGALRGADFEAVNTGPMRAYD